MTEAARKSIVLLSEDTGGDVMVVPMDRDTFLLTVQDAVRACRAFDRAIQFGEQFKELLDELTKWLECHRDKIKSAHLTIRDDDILFLVMQRKTVFDRELSDILSELDIEIANDDRFDLISMNVMDAPPVSRESLSAFLSSGDVYTYAK